MSATTIHITDNTTKARFLAPGTHQRADAGIKRTSKGKGQGALPAKGPTKTTKGRAIEPASSAEDEAFAAGDLVLIPLSRLVPSAFNVRKSGGEDVGEMMVVVAGHQETRRCPGDDQHPSRRHHLARAGG